MGFIVSAGHILDFSVFNVFGIRRQDLLLLRQSEGDFFGHCTGQYSYSSVFVIQGCSVCILTGPAGS